MNSHCAVEVAGVRRQCGDPLDDVLLSNNVKQLYPYWEHPAALRLLSESDWASRREEHVPAGISDF